MVKSILSTIAFALLSLMLCGSAFAQQTYNLPKTGCSFPYLNGYGGNFTCSDVPQTINGIPYLINFSGHINVDNTITVYSGITFWNQNYPYNTVTSTGPMTGAFVPNTCPPHTNPCFLGALNLNFPVVTGDAGNFAGSAQLNMFSVAISRFRGTIEQSGSTITMTENP